MGASVSGILHGDSIPTNRSNLGIPAAIDFAIESIVLNASEKYDNSIKYLYKLSDLFSNFIVQNNSSLKFLWISSDYSYSKLLGLFVSLKFYWAEPCFQYYLTIKFEHL